MTKEEPIDYLWQHEIYKKGYAIEVRQRVQLTTECLDIVPARLFLSISLMLDDRIRRSLLIGPSVINSAMRSLKAK